MFPITLSHFFLCSTLNLVLSQYVTVQYLTEFSEEYTVEVNSTDLKETLPRDEIHRLTIVDGTIPTIKEDTISDFPFLKILQIRQHGVEEIEPGALKNVPVLEVVRLNGNKIKEIKERVFNNLSVVFLNLDHNSIETVSSKAFDNLQQLQVLDLSYNQIKELHPQWFTNKPFLVFVSLTYNNIERLVDGVFENYHQGIDLSNNKIRNVSRGVFGSGDKKIDQLWLNDNGIEHWDEEFLQDVKIGVFDISRNQLECLVGDFGHFFVARQSRIDGNPWDCECLIKISKWVSENGKRVQMRSSLRNCNSTN